jgi:NhaP-type Na+/H+ or K+/H+ antiporter
MLTTGFTIFLGVGLLLAKLPRRTMLRALKYDLSIDLMVTVLTLLVHWGTFSGVMAATVAGLLTSLATSGLKRLVGYADSENYYPGRIRLDV